MGQVGDVHHGGNVKGELEQDGQQDIKIEDVPERPFS